MSTFFKSEVINEYCRKTDSRLQPKNNFRIFSRRSITPLKQTVNVSCVHLLYMKNSVNALCIRLYLAKEFTSEETVLEKLECNT